MSVSVLEDLRWFVSRARAPRLRTVQEFSSDEIVVPDGPYRGRRWRYDRQPYTRLLDQAIDSGRWTRVVVTGPTQSGKTLSAFVKPLMYHLFEVSETVICGVPDMDMAGDKWRLDMLPAIQASSYRDLLPVTGGGSRGGRVDRVDFRNGASLKFMSGGGGDKGRAGFTARVVLITETDGMDEPGEASREADKITQLEARTMAYGSRRRVYMECTVSVEQGRTWREYTTGTQSRICTPCPHCGEYVTLEREHLTGWQDAETEEQAAAQARWCCSACGEAWSEEQRRQANLRAVLAHRGQTVDRDGVVHGEAPKTDTLGFRWSAVNNLFIEPSYIAVKEWRAARSDDADNAERELCQFVHATPYCPPEVQITSLDSRTLVKRHGSHARGLLPPGTTHVTIGIDVGKWRCHWTALAEMDDGGFSVVNYDVIEVDSERLGVERGLLAALSEFQEQVVSAGFTLEGQGVRPVEQVWIDSRGTSPDGTFQGAVFEACRRFGWRPCQGFGQLQFGSRSYAQPSKRSNVVRWIGEQYHLAWVREQRMEVVQINADYWKSRVHDGLSIPSDEPGAIRLFRATPREHLSFAKHLTAEREIEEFVAGRGTVKRWEQKSKTNHWLDATYLARAAMHLAAAVGAMKQPARAPVAPRRRSAGSGATFTVEPFTIGR